MSSASVETRKSVALGRDVRLESSEIVGSALEFEGHILHMTIFANDANELPKEEKGGLERASRRRAFRFR